MRQELRMDVALKPPEVAAAAAIPASSPVVAGVADDVGEADGVS